MVSLYTSDLFTIHIIIMNTQRIYFFLSICKGTKIVPQMNFYFHLSSPYHRSNNIYTVISTRTNCPLLSCQLPESLHDFLSRRFFFIWYIHPLAPRVPQPSAIFFIHSFILSSTLSSSCVFFSLSLYPSTSSTPLSTS